MTVNRISRSADRGVFPQGFLRFLATCIRMKCTPIEACRMYRRTHRLSLRHGRDVELIERGLATGSPLAVEVARIERVFPSWMGPLLNWGQKNGDPATALEEGAGILELESRIQSAVQARLTYPIILLVICGLTTAYTATIGEWLFQNFMDFPVVPTPGAFDQDWPLAYRAIQFSAAVSAHAIPVATAAVALLIAFACALLIPGVPGASAARAIAERLIFGAARARRRARQSLQIRLLARALESSTPLPEALMFIEPLSWDRSTRDRLERARVALESGTEVREALRGDGDRADFLDIAAGGLSAPDPLGALRELARDLHDEATVGLEHLGRSLTPAAVLITAACFMAVPAGQFLQLIRALDTLSSTI